MKLEFSIYISKNTSISNFVKIRPVIAELFYADEHKERRMDGETYEDNSRFSKFCERVYKCCFDFSA
jgi:hypothetical protein